MAITVGNELEKINAQVLELHVALGQAMLDDDQKGVTRLTKELTEAQSRQAQLEQANSSLALAQQHAVTIADERAAKAAQDALEKQIDEADSDLQGLLLAARKVDAALVKLDVALFDLSDMAQSYVDKHSNLGIVEGTKNFLRQRGWQTEVATHFKEKSEMRRYFRERHSKFITYGRGCSIESTIPEISEVLSGKMTTRKKG